METIETKKKNTFKELKEKLGLSSVMETPKIEKVVISIGTGSTDDKKKVELMEDRITKIAGQKPIVNKAKKSIASFKLREGDPVGLQITLRGRRMDDFLDKLINIALPRTKDFRGVSEKGLDEMGNYTLGIKEHTIFPETSDEDVRDIFGMSITFVTTAKDKKVAKELLVQMGLPFAKTEEV